MHIALQSANASRLAPLATYPPFSALLLNLFPRPISRHPALRLTPMEFLTKTRSDTRNGVKGNSRKEANKMQGELAPEDGESQM